MDTITQKLCVCFVLFCFILACVQGRQMINGSAGPCEQVCFKLCMMICSIKPYASMLVVVTSTIVSAISNV